MEYSGGIAEYGVFFPYEGKPGRMLWLKWKKADLKESRPKVQVQALAFSGVLNVILNLFFVICLKMTVNGVAIATVM